MHGRRVVFHDVDVKSRGSPQSDSVGGSHSLGSECDLDVAPGRVGVGADVMADLHELVRLRLVNAVDLVVEVHAQLELPGVGREEFDLGGRLHRIGVELDPLILRHKDHRVAETSRVPGREQELGVGFVAFATQARGDGDRHVDHAVLALDVPVSSAG